MEKLDSFWFFSNVLSSECPPMASDTDEKVAQFSPDLCPEPEATKPLTHISLSRRNQIEIADVLVQLQMCGSCGGSAAATGPQIAKAEILEVLPPGKEETRRRRRSKRSFRYCLNQRRMVHGEPFFQVKSFGCGCGLWELGYWGSNWVPVVLQSAACQDASPQRWNGHETASQVLGLRSGLHRPITCLLRELAVLTSYYVMIKEVFLGTHTTCSDLFKFIKMAISSSVLLEGCRL